MEHPSTENPDRPTGGSRAGAVDHRSSAAGDPTDRERLAGDVVGTRDLAFFVVGAAAPLTVMVGFAPLAFLFGGVTAPLGYLVAGLVYLLFAVGFSAMSRHVTNSGAFYAYISAGIGERIGSGAAVMAYVAYALGQIGFVAAAGLFAASTLDDVLGVQLSWQVCALAIAALVGLLALRRVDLGAKVMAVLLTAEVGVLLVLSVAILASGGADGIDFRSFDVSNFASSGVGGLFVITFVVFIGFEQTAIYGEEARDPKRTVARATYLAVGFLTVVYTLVSWILILGIGPDRLTAALAGDPATLVFGLGDGFVGSAFVKVMEVLIVTSYIAGVLALQNASTRYLFSMGRQGLLPARLARTSVSGAPAVAAGVQAAIVLLALVAFGVSGLDPYTQIVVWTNTPTLIGVLVLQVLTSIAVIRFLRRPEYDERPWVRLGAPALAGLAIVAVLVLVLDRMDVLTGLDTWGNVAIVAPLPIAFAVGLLAFTRRSRTASVPDPPQEVPR